MAPLYGPWLAIGGGSPQKNPRRVLKARPVGPVERNTEGTADYIGISQRIRRACMVYLPVLVTDC